MARGVAAEIQPRIRAAQSERLRRRDFYFVGVSPFFAVSSFGRRPSRSAQLNAPDGAKNISRRRVLKAPGLKIRCRPVRRTLSLSSRNAPWALPPVFDLVGDVAEIEVPEDAVELGDVDVGDPRCRV